MPKDTFTQAQQRMLDRYEIAAESRFVDSTVVAGRVHVLVAGEGPPVVFINGIGTPAAMWAPLMAHLRGYTLYAIDLPGFGRTDTVPHLTRDYRRTAVGFLEEVFDQLDLEQPRIVSNSLGSLWAMWMALDRPARLAAMVHVGCPALALGTSAPLPMRLLSVPVLGEVLMKLQPPSLKQVEQLSKMVGEYPLVPELVDLLVATERLPGFEATFLDTLHTLVRLRGARPELALGADLLTRVTQPVQFIWGSDDPMGPPSVGRRAVQLMDDAECHEVDGGHAPWLTQGARVAALATSFFDRLHDAR